MRPTIYDVAHKAGVGIGTVSRVLNNSGKVSAATRKVVNDAIVALGYKPNSIARQLSLKTRIRNIGVIMQPFVHYQSFIEQLRGMQKALNDRAPDYELVLYTVSSLEHYRERLGTIVQMAMVEGLILTLDLSEEQLDMLGNAKLPIVGINHLANPSWPSITSNDFEGGYLATSHLIELGHRRIAYVGDRFVEDYTLNTSRQRFLGFRQALQDAGLPLSDDYLQLGTFGFDEAKAHATRLFTQTTPPTAIFAMSDIQALGCIAAAKESGLLVPDDVSVIGYDDLELSYHTGLTTVRQHLELAGRKAVEYLLAVIGGDEQKPPRLPPLEVIKRQSTRALSPRQ